MPGIEPYPSGDSSTTDASDRTSLDSAAYCFDLVRRHDHDRFLTGLFAPADRRNALFALYAFNIEVAKTRESVSEPLLGEIRLQWWMETLQGISRNDVRRHPVAEGLALAVDNFMVPVKDLETLVEARRFDLEDEPPATLETLEQYAQATSATLQVLASQLLAGNAEAGRAADAVGMAWAITGLLRALPHHAARGQLYLPKDEMESAGLTAESVREGRSSAALRRVIDVLIDRARLHLNEARKPGLRNAISRNSRAAVLLAPLADLYLERMARRDYDPFGTPTDIPAFRRQVRLVRKALFHTY